MLKKSTLLKYGPAVILFLSVCGISTYKIPFLINLQLNIPALKLLYILFFISLLILIFRLHKNISQLLLQTLPTEIILILTISITDAFQTNILHWFLTTFTNVWLVTLTFYLLHKYNIYHKKNYFKENTIKKTTTANKKLYSKYSVIALIIIISIHFFFGLYHLDKSAYVDERLWTYSDTKRIEKYWVNIIERDWGHTRPSDKPGISLAFISGPSLLFTTPSDFKKENNPDIQEMMHMLFIMRLPLLIFSSVILLFFYYTVTTATNQKIGLSSTAFIGLSPIILGVSRLINPDALSWAIIPLTIIAYFNYQKTKKLSWLYITGILLGWGILTKYIANILFIFFLLSVFTKNFFYKTISTNKIKRDLQASLSSLAIITLISLVTFYIFYPGAWVRPERLLIGTLWSQPFKPVWQYFVMLIVFLGLDYFLNSLSITTQLAKALHKLRNVFIITIPTFFFISTLFTLYNVYVAQTPIDFESIISSPKTSILNADFVLNFKAFITSFYTLLFGISPIALVGIIFASLPKWKYQKFETFNFLLTWHMFLFIIIFYIASIFSKTVPIVRYQIIIYPLAFILAVYGWHQFFSFFCKKKYTTAFYILILLIISTSTMALYSIRPHYFSYNSLILPKKQLINLKDMGDGIYETAQYLNALPNAKNLNVWSDRKLVCSLFVGKCTNVINLKEFIEDGPDYDYYVVSRGHKHKTVRLIKNYLIKEPSYPLRLDRLYLEEITPVFEIWPGNRPTQYMKILDSNKITVLIK